MAGSVRGIGLPNDHFVEGTPEMEKRNPRVAGQNAPRLNQVQERAAASQGAPAPVRQWEEHDAERLLRGRRLHNG